jgi:riboflavin synthase
MFTGIIEELGAVESIQSRAAGARLKVRCQKVLGDMREGASIAVNGVCLTAVDLRPESFSADLAPETLERSNLGALRALSRVNLERPLTPDSRLSGHIVQGHVDATGEFLSLTALGDENWWLKVRVPAELDAYLVYKGSVAIDGISLTIAALEGDVLSVTIIPHTYRNTTLGTYQPGSRVNIECDILAKHVEKLIRNLELKPRLTVERLRDEGY